MLLMKDAKKRMLFLEKVSIENFSYYNLKKASCLYAFCQLQNP